MTPEPRQQQILPVPVVRVHARITAPRGDQNPPAAARAAFLCGRTLESAPHTQVRHRCQASFLSSPGFPDFSERELGNLHQSHEGLSRATLEIGTSQLDDREAHCMSSALHVNSIGASGPTFMLRVPEKRPFRSRALTRLTLSGLEGSNLRAQSSAVKPADVQDTQLEVYPRLQSMFIRILRISSLSASLC